jgi:hypothetical protein
MAIPSYNILMQLGAKTQACHLCYMGSINRRITVWGGLGIKQDPISKVIKAKRVGAWLKWQSSSKMSQVQTLVTIPSLPKTLNFLRIQIKYYAKLWYEAFNEFLIFLLSLISLTITTN